MARRNQFTVDAESVQGNEGATVTFKLITLGTRDRYLKDPEYGDAMLLGDHLLDWHGIEDDAGNEMPSPKDEPGLVATLYLSEVTELVRLLMEGQRQTSPKN
jgi:hypothetical protein